MDWVTILPTHSDPYIMYHCSTLTVLQCCALLLIRFVFSHLKVVQLEDILGQMDPEQVGHWGRGGDLTLKNDMIKILINIFSSINKPYWCQNSLIGFFHKFHCQLIKSKHLFNQKTRAPYMM